MSYSLCVFKDTCTGQLPLDIRNNKLPSLFNCDVYNNTCSLYQHLIQDLRRKDNSKENISVHKKL